MWQNCVANAARIEGGDSYRFYAEGATPAVARLYQAINRERVMVAAALGAAVPTLEDWFDRVYGVREANLVETCRQLTYNSDGPYQATGTPSSLEHKFITEDVPTGLIPMSVAVVRNMTGKDFASEARTLARLGLSGMSATEIRRVMDQGFGYANLAQERDAPRPPAYAELFRGGTPTRIHNLYTDAGGQSHFRDIEVEWVEERRGSKLSKRLPATGIIFRET